MRYEDILSVARFAKRNGGTGPLSTGESLVAAIVCDKPEWIKEMGYTLAEGFARACESSDMPDSMREAQYALEADVPA